MKGINDIFRFGVVLLLVFGVSQTALARRAKPKKKGQLVESIKDAMERSESDQEKIRVQFDDEADQRIETWKTRKQQAIEIKHTGTSSIEPADLGEPDYSYEETGVDQSGLDNLHSDIDDEPTDINFDEELREVSSVKD